jgi:hypothetical protein
LTRTQILLAAWIAAALTLLALAGGASAADSIPGAQVSYYSNGAGQFYAYYYAHHGGGSTDFYLPPFSNSSAGNADAGVNLAIYNSAGTSATTYGLHGQQPFLNLTPPTRTGNGTSTPYVLETQYYAGDYDLNGICQGNPCLRVTEQVQYQSTSPDFLFFTYKVTNDGTDPAKFRLSAASDTDTTGGVGTGFFESGTPRALGTVNQRYGASVAYQEVASSSWDHWQEGLPFEIWRRVESPITSGAPSTGLNDTPNPGAPTTPNGDKAMAVQWDDYVSGGLAGGANHDFQVYLRFNDYDSVVLSNPGYVMTDSNKPVTVSLDVKDQYGNGVPLQASDVRYRIAAGPNAPVDQSWQVQAPSGGTGHAAVTWNWNSTKVAAADEVDFWIDLNHDGVKDVNEPDTYQYASWYDGFRLSSQYSSRIIGNSNQVSVTSYNTSHTIIGRDFKWKVTGANPNTNAGDPANGMWDCTGACNLNPIALGATNAGVDHVEVWEDINGDLDYDDYGEKRVIDVTWLSGLRVISDNAKHTKGSGNFTVTAALQATNGSAINGVPLYYRVAGANPQGTSSCAPGSTLANPATENTACKTALTAPGSYTGGNAPIQLQTATEGEDVLTVWQEVDGVPGTGPTSGDHVIAIGNYVTALSPDQRLTTNAGTSVTYRITGDTFNLTTTLKLANGAADGRAVNLRYYIYSNGPDYAGPGEQEIANDGSGHATIPLPDAGGVGCDSLDIYADLNGNDQQDANEPYDSPYVCWRDRVMLTPDYTTVYQPDSDYVYVELRHADGSDYDGDYTYTVDGGAPQTGTTFFGSDSFRVPSQSVGPHTVHVEFDDPVDLTTQSQDVVLTWATKQSLTLTSEATDASTGATMHVTAALTDYGGGPAAAGTLLHYQVYGANDDSGKKVVETDASGHATISWTGDRAGDDTVYVWPDYNANGIEDQNEQDVEKWTTVTFHERVEVTPDFDSKFENNQETVTVKFHDDLYNELANQWLTYRVTGANPISAPLVKTDAHGVAAISWTGNEPGNDELVVWQDTDGDTQPDVDEVKSPPMDMHWSQRLSASPSTFSTQHTGTAFTVNTHLAAPNGSDQSGAILHWVATGASTASGDTPATDANGDASFQINSDVAGRSDIRVFLDSNGNGARDAGEPQDLTYVNWTNEITLSCSGCSQTKPEGNTQAVTATKNPVSLPGTLYYRVEGANPVPKTAYTGTITLTGTKHGTDRLYVWADTGGSTDQEPGDVVSVFYETWTPRIDLQGGDGYRVAGGTVSIAVQHLNAAGLPTNTAGTTLNYTVAGKNPRTGSVQTNSQGRASISWTADNAGADTLTVTDGTFTSTESVYWNAPPVTLSLARSDANPDYPTRSHSITATINGVTIPVGGFPVHFTVSGANSTSQTVQSNAAGVAVFNWTPANDGTDTVSAYADVSGTSSYDGFDPSAAVNVTWKPLFVVNTATSDQAIGEPHTETITFLDNSGNPLPDGTDVIYQISGANPTAGTVLQARPVSTDAGGPVHAKISGGQASVTWTGVNSGTDTLDVWADTDASQTVTGTDPHATRTITWRTATASSAPPGGGTPVGTSSQVTPGSANDFDGVATPPPPVVAKSVNVEPISGRVFVRLPGRKNFVELLDAEQIPVGSIVDVRKGTVALTSAQNLKGGVATAQFYAGQFQIAQKKAAKPVTDLVLYGGSFKGCAKLSRKSSAGVSQKKKVRELWGNGKGLFRTKGKYAAAAVRGTKWDVVDYCDGTLVKVAQGLVQVQPIKGKARLLKAPKSLFVPVAGLAKKRK